MKEDYYIEAAIDLNLITGSYISINSDNDEIIQGNIVVLVTDNIISRAIFLEALKHIRDGRNAALASTDWIAMSDNTTAADIKEPLMAYRQALRDCPSSLVEGSEDMFEYPTYPE